MGTVTFARHRFCSSFATIKSVFFGFCSLSTPTGRLVAGTAGLAGNSAGSILLQYKGKIYSQSDAVLTICKLLGGTFRLLSVFQLFLADFAISFMALLRAIGINGLVGDGLHDAPDLVSRFILS